MICSNNCQDFAIGLGNFLTTDCIIPEHLRSDNDNDLVEYIMSISVNSTCADSGVPSTVPLQFVSTVMIVVGILAAAVI